MLIERCLNIYGFILLIELINVNSLRINDERCLNYCSNDGICLIINNKPECYCLPEWDGERCDIVRQIKTNYQSKSIKLIHRNYLRNDPCTFVPNLCKNGGVCFLDE